MSLHNLIIFSLSFGSNQKHPQPKKEKKKKKQKEKKKEVFFFLRNQKKEVNKIKELHGRQKGDI